MNQDQSKRALWLPSPEYAKGYGSVVNFPGVSFFAKIIAGTVDHVKSKYRKAFVVSKK